MDNVQTLIDKLKTEIEAGKPAEEIFEFLNPVLGKHEETDMQVADALATMTHPAAAGLLVRILAIAGSKKLAKTIRRSLYRLKGRGIPVEETPPDHRESIFRAPRGEPSRGFGSSIDSLGERFLLLALPRPGRGWAVIQAGVSDIQGLVNFVGDEMTRKGFRAFMSELKNRFPFPLVDIEPPYVAFLIAQAHQLTVQRDVPPHPDYIRFKADIDGIKKEYEKPLVHSYLRIDETTEADRHLKTAGDLLKSDVFAGWMIETDQVQPYADAVQEAEASKLVLNPVQKEARIQEIYQKALSDLFSGKRRALYELRLAEMADVLFKLGREEEARTSLAAAMDLEKPMNPFQPNPFLLQLVIASIYRHLKDDYEKKVKEPSLIVKP